MSLNAELEWLRQPFVRSECMIKKVLSDMDWGQRKCMAPKAQVLQNSVAFDPTDEHAGHSEAQVR